MTFLRPHFLSATGLTSMRSKVLVVLVLFLALPSLCSAKDPTKALPPRYRDWLKKDAVYIITNEEKDAFLSLTADDARDRFIERFWEIRNPTPGSPDPVLWTRFAHRGMANRYGEDLHNFGRARSKADIARTTKDHAHGDLVLLQFESRPSTIFLHRLLPARSDGRISTLQPI